ncbi:MAG: alpha/beta hydrolase [Hyphomicrobium sp.]|jgi:pimeloyl-ACP methyl ester carboxylesterase|nr:MULTISPECIES: alpha/beta hydrolase [Sphingomonadaceae]MBA4172958.1 alpha/beta hydrolase [Hyphomicrobium sp.]|tara:strand:+ start:1792 stop:2769 length:978 start_codon:yes stop_codon:yes gene_type:complete
MHPTLSKNLVRLAVALGLAAATVLTSQIAPTAALAKSTKTSVVGGSLHQFAKTQFVTVDGTRLAYRRFGKQGGVPLVFFQHFLGNMDNWDPMITDGFSKNREVVIFDNAGVAGSEGQVPHTVQGMAKYGIGLIEALHIKQTDILGFSLGSLVAQEVAFQRPDLVRKVILIGSAPRGGDGMATLTPEFQAMLTKKYEPADTILLTTFFNPTLASQAAGQKFLDRIRLRTVDRDANPGPDVYGAQVAAFAAWGTPSANSNDYLKSIKQPVLIVSGSKDLIHYTSNSYKLEDNLPNAELVVYPDTNHGSFYQYPELFLQQATTFLDQK